MKTIIRLAGIIILLWAAGMADNAQESQADHAVVNFSNPAKPGTLEVDLSEGSITIRGYEGKEVIIDAAGEKGFSKRKTKRSLNPSPKKKPKKKSPGRRAQAEKGQRHEDDRGRERSGLTSRRRRTLSK